jgi:hypothetical protein
MPCRNSVLKGINIVCPGLWVQAVTTTETSSPSLRPPQSSTSSISRGSNLGESQCERTGDGRYTVDVSASSLEAEIVFTDPLNEKVRESVIVSPNHFRLDRRGWTLLEVAGARDQYRAYAVKVSIFDSQRQELQTPSFGRLGWKW